ncbi:MAG: hypothetical protein KJZ64_07025, partial [Sphingomonadaceae bacterium]|nr:hypothetical protein [Sphingomonadaceae bacterium]
FGDGKPTIALITPLPPQGPASDPPPAPPAPPPPPTGEGPCERTKALLDELERIRGDIAFDQTQSLPGDFADRRDALLKRKAEIEAELSGSPSECPVTPEALPRPSGESPCERTAELMAELQRIRGNPSFNASDPLPPSVADERDALRQRAAEIEAELASSQLECPSAQGEPLQAPPAPPEDPNPRPPVREEYPVVPIPRMADPCEEARLIRERIEQISKIAERNATRGVPFEFEDQAAAGQIKQLQQRLADLAKDCPIEREPSPPPSAPEPKPVTTTPPVTINVKATSRAVEEGRDAPELANQVIRLFGPDDLDVALPTAQGGKPQDGHDRDPVQVVTNDAGEATASIRVPLRFAIDQSRETDSGVTLGPRVRLTFDATPQDSVNVIADKPEDLSGLLLRESLRESLIGIDRIGNITVGTLQFDKDKAEVINTLLRNDLPQVRVEPNLCRVKEPAAITEYHACKLGERRPPAGARILEPPGPHAELPGARITFGAIEQERGE